MKDTKDNKKKEVIEEKQEEKKTRRRIKRVKKQEENDIINKSVEFNLLEVIVIILITGIAVSITSGLIVYNNYDKLFVRESSNNTNSELKEFTDVYNEIVNNYVKEVDKEALIEAGISGLYSYLQDDFSTYIDKEYSEALEEQLDGEYDGIGIEMITYYENGEPTVTKISKVFRNTPAEEAGLQVGDILKKVDGIVVEDATFVANTIKKGNKDSYEVTYERDGEEHTLKINKKRVQIDSVSSKTYDNVGYLKIDTFSNMTYSQVKSELNNLSNVDSLVIDLRDNTGGYLQSAYNIADLFLEKDKVIYQLKDRTGSVKSYKAQEDVYRKYNKIVVIVNTNTASASEVLTLALKENLNATVVGATTYGKGTVQDTKILSSGAMVKYTSAYWLSPKGNLIDGIGIKPDIAVENEESQLEEALKAAK